MKKILMVLFLVLLTCGLSNNSFGQMGSITPDGLGGFYTNDGQGNSGSITPDGLGGFYTN